jgi:ketosteroid isomerase-like protein
MGAPSPELCNLWLARAFNAQDVEAAAAMYHPDAAIVQVDESMAASPSRAAPTASARRWRPTSASGRTWT